MGWSLLLAHMACLPPDASSARAVLKQAVREVPSLVAKLLDVLLEYLPCGQYAKAARGAAPPKAPAGACVWGVRRWAGCGFHN